ncbi:MAG TPA: tetratricopeptide repeat protein [Candidatus Acidoferrum sp.]|nr:tetratricopeptide repeat protein [Candidatus Acidoferrum sp.]
MSLTLLQSQVTQPVIPEQKTASAHDRAQLSSEEITRLETQAEGGDATAQLELARAYEEGNGVTVDQVSAAEWYRKAADQGNSNAQNQLGIMYQSGRGVERDESAAVAWYRKSARQGNSAAMFNLGAAYYNGTGVGTDDALSYAWFTLAKQAGNPSAANAVQIAESEMKPWSIAEGFEKLGMLYDTGEYLPPDPVQAVHWLTEAARRGDADAQAEVAAKLLGTNPMTQDFAQGRYWCNELAKRGGVRGVRCMGAIYQRGIGVKADLKEARKWYERGATSYDALSVKALAQMEVNGEGGKVDREAACLEYVSLVHYGDAEAIQSLAALRKEMGPKQWKKVQEQFLQRRIDPKKVDTILDEVESP